MWSLNNLRDAEDLIWGSPSLERHIVTKYSSSEVSSAGLVDTGAFLESHVNFPLCGDSWNFIPTVIDQ